MVARETQLQNAYESTLISALSASSSDQTVSVAASPGSIADFSSGTSGFYLVIDPDSDSTREYVYISAKTGVNLTATRNIDTYGGGLNAHSIGAKVRFVAMAEMFDDVHDRLNTIINEAGTAVVTTGVVKDQDDMASDSATHLATQQSIKKYVDDNVTAQDLDLISDSGTIDIDLDSESLTVTGGEGIDTSATGTTLTIAGEDATTSNKGIASFATANFTVASGAVSIKTGGIDLADEVTGTLPTTNGGTGLSSFTAGDLVYFSTGTALSKLAKGTAGQVLAMNSGATAPEWKSDTDTTYSAGDGLDLSGTTFSTDLKANGGLVIESTELALDLAASSITGTLAVSDGGTGQTTYTNGQLLIGNTTGNTLTKASLTGGTNVTITPGAGSITIAATDTNTTYTAGDGLDLSGTTFSTDLKANGGLVIESTEVAIDLGASSITGTLAVGDGGTGLTGVTAGDILYASGTDTIAKLAKGSANQVLAMNSGATAPEWVAATTGDITGVTAGDGITGGGVSGTVDVAADLKSNGGLVIESTEIAVDLGASSITGTLDETDGGTGLTSYTGGDVIYASGSNTLAKLAKGSAGQVLKMNSGATAPEWAADAGTTYTAGDGLDLSSTEFSVDLKANGGLVIESTEVAIDLSASSITGTLDETDGGTGLTSYTAGDILYASGSNTLAKLAKGTSGQTLKMNSGATAPEWASASAANAIVDGDSDFTLSDGVASGIHYELDNTDMADWNQAGVVLTTAGGIFQHNQVQAATYTVPANTGSVMAGPITITGTVTNNGTLVVI